MSNYHPTGQRARLHREANGRCFYCGVHVQLGSEPLPRDWLLLKKFTRRMVPEHMTPIIRGGDDSESNKVSSCYACNAAKSSLTVDEFRFVRGLRTGSLSMEFHGELGSRVQRDWLCCHSRSFERTLFASNYPGGAIAYSRGWHGKIKPVGRPL